MRAEPEKMLLGSGLRVDQHISTVFGTAVAITEIVVVTDIAD